MSAAEKLRALEKSMRRHKTEMLYPESASLRDALSQIVAVVEAAERVKAKAENHGGNGQLVDIARTLHPALAALDEALG